MTRVALIGLGEVGSRRSYPAAMAGAISQGASL